MSPAVTHTPKRRPRLHRSDTGWEPAKKKLPHSASHVAATTDSASAECTASSDHSYYKSPSIQTAASATTSSADAEDDSEMEYEGTQ